MNNNKQQEYNEKMARRRDEIRRDVSKELEKRRIITHRLGLNFELLDRLETYLHSHNNLFLKDFKLLRDNTLKIIYTDLCKLSKESDSSTAIIRLLKSFQPTHNRYLKLYYEEIHKVLKPLIEIWENKKNEALMKRVQTVRDKYVSHECKNASEIKFVPIEELKNLHLMYKDVIQKLSTEFVEEDISDRDFIQPIIRNQQNVFRYLTMLSNSVDIILDCKLRHIINGEELKISEKLSLPYINLINKSIESTLLISVKQKHPNFEIINYQSNIMMKFDFD